MWFKAEGLCNYFVAALGRAAVKTRTQHLPREACAASDLSQGRARLSHCCFDVLGMPVPLRQVFHRAQV